MEILDLEEQEDGSAIIHLDISEQEKSILLEFAITELLKKYIRENPVCAEPQNNQLELDFGDGN